MVERGIAYRRFMEEVHVMRRAKLFLYNHWYYLTDVNNNLFNDTKVSNFIGTQTYFGFKSYSTSKYDSRNKAKYSDNHSYWSSTSRNTRRTNKKYFNLILKEYGVK